MKTVELSALNKQFRAMVRSAQTEALVLTSRGRAVAAIVGLSGVDAETASLSTNPKFLRILRRSFADLAHGRTVTLAEIRKRVKAE